MAIKTLFFNDTDYYASDFVKPFASLINNSVLTMTDFLVAAANPNNLSVDVSSGKAFIEGYFIELDITTNLPITANTSGFNRIDTVCLKLDINTQQSILTILQGTPSGTPAIPTIPTDDGVHYIELANILIGNNVSVITSGNITDARKINQTSQGTVSAIQNTEYFTFIDNLDCYKSNGIVNIECSDVEINYTLNRYTFFTLAQILDADAIPKTMKQFTITQPHTSKSYVIRILPTGHIEASCFSADTGAFEKLMFCMSYNVNI